MSMGHTFHEFGELVTELESTGVEIIDIAPHQENLLTDESLTLDLSVGIRPFSDIDTNGIEIVPRGSDAMTNGNLTVDLSVRIPLDHESKEHSSDNQLEPTVDQDDENIEPEDAGGIQSTESKPYRDPDRLQEVYDEYDTFEEMTDGLGVDVTSETVRSNMVKLGIHEPETNGTDADSNNGDTSDDTQQLENDVKQLDGHDEEVLVSDGMGLPEGMTLDEFKTTIQTSRSFLDVQRALGGDRDHTYQLLKKLDLIDLVHGRLSKQAEREPSLDEIENRIRQSMTR